MFRTRNRNGERGQMIMLFAFSITLILLVVGLVVDGGNALVQRRNAQNTADFAALAGARIVAEKVGGDLVNGTDDNVKAAINRSIAVNKGTFIAYGSPNGPQYVSSSGATIGFVGAAPTIPSGAVGVKLSTPRAFHPFFLGILGQSTWTTTASATAKGGYSSGPPPGTIFPMGIAQAFFDGRQPCAGDISATVGDPCYPAHLTTGGLNVPGGFGWLKFGCSGYGLGQGSDGGCANSKPFLQAELGPPGNSYGCCTQVGLPGSPDYIGSLPGNKASADCDWYITHQSVMTVPVWDSAGGSGSNAYYHVVGFTGFQVTACHGGKDVEGVWRVPIYVGPTTTDPGFAGAPLAVQLVR